MSNERVWNHDMAKQSGGVITRTEFAHHIACMPIKGLVYVRTPGVLLKQKRLGFEAYPNRIIIIIEPVTCV